MRKEKVFTIAGGEELGTWGSRILGSGTSGRWRMLAEKGERRAGIALHLR